MAPKALPFVQPFDDAWLDDSLTPSALVNRIAADMANTWATAAGPAGRLDRLPRDELVWGCQEVLARPAAAHLAADLALQELVALHQPGRGFAWAAVGALMDGMTAQGAQQHFARPLQSPDARTYQLRNELLAQVTTQLRRGAEDRLEPTAPPPDARQARPDLLARRMHRTLARPTRGTLRDGWEPPLDDLFRVLWEARRYLVALEWCAVRPARELGLSWAQIGSAIGLSRQGTQKRYDPLAPNGGSGGPRNRRVSAAVPVQCPVS